MSSKTFTFHVHLPEGLDKFGQPIVLGNRKELGSWENPIVKLRQPFPKNPTYWQSSPINISLSEIGDIKYKYSIHTPNSVLEEKNVLELEGNSDNVRHILNIKS